MESHVSADHPRQKFLFYIEGEIDATCRSAVEQLIRQLATSRRWVIGPPQFVDAVDAAPPSSADLPIETVGGELEIYSALRPLSLPKEVDYAHFTEVETIVEAIRSLSERKQLTFSFELDGTYVGEISNGVADKSLRVGLLGEWRKQLLG
jgi:hypothetical protein